VGTQRRSKAPPDNALIGACLRGDGEAWERLVDRYSGLVYSVIRKYGLDEDEVGDTFQAVWVALWEELDGLRDRGRVAPWLMTVAGRLAWQAGRHRWRWAEAQRAQARLANASDGQPALDDVVLAWERQEEVRAALAEVSPRCRMLVGALFYDPAVPSYAEIASRLGCSENTIGALRGRCFRELRAALARRARRQGEQSARRL